MEYKLIKKYPGLPKDWEEGMIIGHGDYGRAASLYPCSGKYKDVGLPTEHVKDFPEFWKKVVVPDYEILAFATKDGTVKKKNPDTGLFEWDYTNCKTTVEQELKTFKKIHSVKRLSDGMVYTVGDTTHLKKWSDQVWEIVSIELWEDEIILFRTRNRGERWWEDLHAKLESVVGHPIFITEDEYKVSECLPNLELYGVLCKSNWQTKILPCENWLTHNTKDAWKVFYSKEKMEEYILENQPQFSLKEVMSAVNRWAMEPLRREDVINQICKVREVEKMLK